MTRPTNDYAPWSPVWTMVEIPAERGVSNLTQQADLREAPQRGRTYPTRPLRERRTVLVVDDESSIVDLIAEVLEEAGYRALVAHNGRTALAIARRERPAMVLTDRNMPGIDGVEFVRQLRASATTAAIPVVLMSSTRPNAEDTRSVPFLPKPFDLDDMLAMVVAYAGSPDASSSCEPQRTLHG